MRDEPSIDVARATRPDRRSSAAVALGMVVATFLAFSPALTGKLLWNDAEYVTRPDLQSLSGLVRIWTQLGATEQYYPLLHSFFWLQHRLWGDQSLGYHLVNVALHVSCAGLLALLMRRLAMPGAGLAAAIFALHPVHVESVAWITEQKNTLSLAFYLAAALAYLRFDQTRGIRAYAVASGLFLLSLWCKTVTATLPAALLVVLWWRRGKLSARRDVGPLVPWFVVGAGAGLFSSWVERSYLHAQGGDFALSIADRVLVAGRAVWFYLGKFCWPAGLNFVYPRWTPDPSCGWQWLFPLAVAGLALALWMIRRRTRAPLAALLFFAGSLFPVLGFVNLYGARYSFVWDHWQYLPDLGLTALAAAGLTAGWHHPRVGLRNLGRGAGVALVMTLAGLTWRHAGMFRDVETLYLHTIARNPGCWMAQYNLAVHLHDQPGRRAEALPYYEAAARLKPDDAAIRANLGAALAAMPERVPEAIGQLRAALALQPDLVEAHYDLGLVSAATPGGTAEAIMHLERVLQLQPTHRGARLGLGGLLARLPGRLEEGMAQFEAIVRVDPQDAEAHYNLGIAWGSGRRQWALAIAHFEAALRAKPDYLEAENNLGLALLQVPGRQADALAHFAAALQINPRDPAAHFNVGLIFARTPGREPEAIRHFEAVLQVRPDFAPARQMLDRLQQPHP